MAVEHNYFLALLPDRPAAARARQVADELGRRSARLGRPMRPDRLHVSVKGVGADGRPMDDWARRAVAAVTRVRFPPFVVAFNRVAAFGGSKDQRAIVLRGDEGVLGVDMLRDRLHAALADAGLARRRQPGFEAHMTLVRGPHDGPEVVVAPIAWRVRDFVLIHSFVGETRYEIVRRFPLCG